MAIVSAKTLTGHDLPAIIGPDGTPYLLGAIPSREAITAAAPWSPGDVIPRSEWPKLAFDRRRTTLAIWDQNPLGSCVPHGLLRALYKTWLDEGVEAPLPSRGFAYAMVNGGRDAGADPADIIDMLTSIGVCTEATVPYRFLTRDQIPSAAFQEAKRFVQPEGFVRSCGNFDEMVSAAIRGWHLGVTVRVGRQYTDVDKNGVSPATAGMGNHEQNGGDALKFTPGGTPLLAFDQSWGTWFGDKGRHWLYEAHFDNQPGMQVYAFKYAAPDPTDLIPPAA